MHWVDYIIIAVIGLSVITGLLRGFVKEIVALGIWILAIWLAYTYSQVLDPLLLPYIQDKTARTATSFVAIMIATLIAGGLFNVLLSIILRRSGLSGTDRLLGTGFGFIRGVFIVALVMLMVNMTSIPYQHYRSQSQLYAKFDPLVGWLSGFMPQLIQQVKIFENADKSTDVATVDNPNDFQFDPE